MEARQIARIDEEDYEDSDYSYDSEEPESTHPIEEEELKEETEDWSTTD